ncbi:hypothetical protein NGRA_0233 [Nosema granulosis]|uniref:Uncharacterized protein n=1 Tax=Nosema granulosis TaxID=83296 RepID=A0A9P6L088_9MICR|nr:hypothetical protein NGRA_0233 [Nosema granulosis]
MIFIVRLVFILLFSYGLTNFHAHKEVIMNKQKKNNYFLTTIGLYLTIVTELMCIFKMKYLYDFIAISFIVEFFITSVFWILIFINQDFIRQRDSNNIPIKNKPLKEYSVHVFPFICLAWEHYNFAISYSRKHVIILNLLNVLYHLILFMYHSKNKEHLYPILNKTGRSTKMLFSLLSFILVNGILQLITMIY